MGAKAQKQVVDRYLGLYSKVVLRGVSPMIWRCIMLRSDETIADLLHSIQIAMVGATPIFTLPYAIRHPLECRELPLHAVCA